MSLILEALQQAEQERGKGLAPDLFMPTPTTVAPALENPRPYQRVLWPATALLLALALLWSLWQLQTPRTSVAVTGASVANRNAGEAPAQASPSTDSAVSGAALFQPAPGSPLPPTAALNRSDGNATSTPRAPQVAAPQTGLAPTSTLTDPAPSPLPTAPMAVPNVPHVHEIDAAQRAGLPPLNITGHTYSDNPTLRMLMIDGHMVVEGQGIAPGLRLERIGPHQAVFNFRGTRFGVDY